MLRARRFTSFIRVLAASGRALAFLAFFASFAPVARAANLGAPVVPGATYGEKQVRLVWARLPRIIDHCRARPAAAACGISGTELALLERIRGAFPARYSPDTLRFLSGAAHPGQFDSASGPHRLAMTGDDPSSAILFNTDELARGLSFAEVVGILVHELGHHQGIKDTPERPLDVLGSKVGAWFARHWSETALAGHAEVRVLAYNLGSAYGELPSELAPGGALLPLLAATDGSEILDLSVTPTLRAFCPFGDYRVEKLWIGHPRWTDADPVDGAVSLKFAAQHACTEQKTRKDFVVEREGLLVKLVLGGARPAGGPVTPSGLALGEDTSARLIGDGVVDGLSGTDGTLAVRSIEASPTLIRNGGTFKVSATVDLPVGDKAQACALRFGSDDFRIVDAQGEPLVFWGARRDCAVKAAAGGRVSVQATFVFPAATPPRGYFLAAIELYTRASPLNPLLAVPQFRVPVRVESAAPPVPARLVSFAPKTDDGKAYRWCRKFELQAKAQPGARQLRAFAESIIRYRNGYVEPYTFGLTDFMGSAQGRGWDAPGADGSLLTHFFQTLLYEVIQFGDASPVAEIEYTRYVELTEDLRELVVDLPPRSAVLTFDAAMWGTYPCE